VTKFLTLNRILKGFFGLSLCLIASQESLAADCVSVFSSKTAIESSSNPLEELPARFSGAEYLSQREGLKSSIEFRDSESVDSFTQANPFWGFLSIGARTLLATRSAAFAENFLTDPASGKSAFAAGRPLAKEITELPGYVVFDLTGASYLSPIISRLQNSKAWDEGPNCWNLCQLYKGWARSSFSTMDSEFALWVDGPFSSPVKTADQLGFRFIPNPGDVIIIRRRGFKSGAMEEVHGAISLGGDLVFTKNGVSYDAPYQLMLLRDMLGDNYLPALGNSIEFRSIKDFDTVWKEWSPKIDLQLKALVNRWMEYEQKHGELFLPDNLRKTDREDYSSPELDALGKGLRKEVKEQAPDKLKLFEGKELSEQQKVEQFFWRMLQMRAGYRYF